MVERWALRRAAIKLLRDNIRLKRGEKIVLVTDRKNDPIYSALKQAATELGGAVREQRIRAGRQHSAPIPEARKVLLWADVVLAPVDSSITHSHETVEAMKRGLRGASMPAIYPGLFVKAMDCDAKAVDAADTRIRKALKAAREVRITSPGGSDFTLYVKDRRVGDNGSDLWNPGSVTNIPFGEVFVAPVETKGDGRIVFDSWKAPPHRGSVWIRNGKIVKCDAGARKYVNYLKRAGRCGLVIAELGFGTNPAFKKPIGNVLQDEKIFGSVHVAFGQNVSMGGKNRCGVHEDVIIMRPTVRVDERLVLAEGKMI